MDASTIALDLFHFGIIPDGVQKSIMKCFGSRQQNSILHNCLLRTCTNEALMRACDIITSVQGNPKMFALGKDMQRRLEAGVWVCVSYFCTPFAGLVQSCAMHAFSETDLSL